MGRPKVHDNALAEVLVSEATRIVGEQGPEALSLRTVTQRAGTSTSAIYSLYGSRDGLLDAVYARAIESFVNTTLTVASSHPLADLFTMGVLYRTWAIENPQMYPVMFGRRSKDSPAEIRTRTASTAEPMLACVQRAIAAGLLRDTDPITVVTQLWATVHGFVTMELDGLLDSALPQDLTTQERYETLLLASLSYWRT